MKIGLFGGSFDPIHMGHLFLAEAAFDGCGLDKVLMLPTPRPYHRNDKNVQSLEHRVNMLKLAIADNSHLEFSDFEINIPGETYTYKTLRHMKESHPDWELYFIVGGDSLFSMESWREPETIFSLATIISTKRENETSGASGLCQPGKCIIDRDGNGVDDRAEAATLQEQFAMQADYLREKYGARIVDVMVPNIEISSSEVISRLRAGKSVKYYLKDSVIDYIKENHLYE